MPRLCVAPGGSLQQDAGSENGVTRCVVCVFSAADEPAILKSYYEVAAVICFSVVDCSILAHADFLDN